MAPVNFLEKSSQKHLRKKPAKKVFWKMPAKNALGKDLFKPTYILTLYMQSDLKAFTDVSGSFLVFKDIYQFFGENIKNSVAIHIGCSDWRHNLQVLESYPLPTVICDPKNELADFALALETHRSKLMDWMKFLKESDCGKHFVNPKWTTVEKAYPSTFDGTHADYTVPVCSWSTLLRKANMLRGKPTQEVHFALCKIECLNEERAILASLLASEYRPSILYVRWSADPDGDQETCEAAGHVQSAGYRLLAIQMDGWFIYHYSGQDIYSCCSWTDVGMSHPLIKMMVEQVSEAMEKMQNPVRNEPVASEGAAPS